MVWTYNMLIYWVINFDKRVTLSNQRETCPPHYHHNFFANQKLLQQCIWFLFPSEADFTIQLKLMNLFCGPGSSGTHNPTSVLGL